MGPRLPLTATALLGLATACDTAPAFELTDTDTEAVAKAAGPGLTVCADGSGNTTTIQGAINLAPSGTTISVCAGTWSENLVIANKSLRLVSQDGAGATILDGGGSGTVLTVAISSAPGVRIEGFTLQDGSGTGAGGLQCFRSTLTVIDSVIQDNAGGDGAGLKAVQCTLSVDGTDFLDNVATGQGGGAFLGGSTGSITSSTFDGNTAEEGGGLALSSSNMTVSGNTISANHATTTDEELHGAGGGGGGVWVYGTATLTDNTIQGNTSDYNGGGLWLYTGSPELGGNTIVDNYSGEDGGGAYTSQTSAWFHDNVVQDNEAFDDAGGLRIYVGTMTVEDNVFDGNTAGDDGGGLKLSHSYQIVRRNTFTDNVAGDAGGGLELDNETTNIEDCIFTGNTATRGAGLHSWRNEGAFTIIGAVFEDNTAHDCGGGVQLDNDPYRITISQSEFSSNTASDGGGLCVDEVELEDGGYDDSVLTLLNTTFFDNTATDDGGAVYLKTAQAEITNSAMSWNTASTASGMVLKSGTVQLTNAIIYRNQGGDGIAVEGGTLTSRFTNVYAHWGHGNWSGITDPTGLNGNISTNPLFPWAAGGDFSLNTGSPCIDTGSPLITDTDGTRSDMGAYGGGGGDW